jgi:hypothetical protein
MKNNQFFCIKCNNKKEFREVQLYLFKLNYEWLDSKKNIFFSREQYPLFITNAESEIYKFIWQTQTQIGKNIKMTSAKDYMLSTIRKEKLSKIIRKY